MMAQRFAGALVLVLPGFLVDMPPPYHGDKDGHVKAQTPPMDTIAEQPPTP